MDCPWCGCGWLFTCISCRMAFTFAEGVVVEAPWKDTARCELTGRWGREPSTEDVAEWVGAMKELLADVRVGQQYVYLDGLIIPTSAAAVRFEGWHSRHDLPFVPHVIALTDRSALSSTLESRAYWRRTATGPTGA